MSRRDSKKGCTSRGRGSKENGERSASEDAPRKLTAFAYEFLLMLDVTIVSRVKNDARAA